LALLRSKLDRSFLLLGRKFVRGQELSKLMLDQAPVRLVVEASRLSSISSDLLNLA
jgi:hypothetical protein